MIGSLEKALLRATFTQIKYMPTIITNVTESFHRRRLEQAFKLWQQMDRLKILSQRRQINLLEDIIEAWKHRVAFKGGHSLHNSALKSKVWKILDKRRKAGKVKSFRRKIAE